MLINDNNIRCIILHPVSTILNCDNTVIEKINRVGTIINSKTLALTWRGFDNLIKECYRGDKWTGGLFSPKSWKKSKKCFVENSSVKIFLVKFNDPSMVTEFKQELREIFNVDKHSLHITDDISDTTRVYKATFNSNATDYLNNGHLLSDDSQTLLINYFNKIEELGLDADKFCVTSSFILEMYGIRKADDLDYIHIDNISLNLKNITQHTDKWLSFYPVSKEDIINKEENYFYFNGFKFVTLDIILRMKQSRKQKKDQNDLKLYHQKINALK
jgi:hypothetical protein